MYRGKGKLFFSLFAVCMLLTVAGAAYSDDSEAATDMSGTSLNVIYDANKSIELNASSSTTLSFFVYNGYTENVVAYVAATSNNESTKVNTSTAPIELVKGENTSIKMTVTADRYAHQGNYSVTLSFKIYKGSDPAFLEQGTYDFPLHVMSNLSSDKYNKFLGFFDNTYTGIMGNVWFTAAVSFLGLLAIGYAVMFVAVPVCSRIVMKKDDPQRKTLKKLLYRLCQVIVWLWVIGQVFRILGADEELIDLINRLFYLAYVVVGIIVGWQLYKLIVDTLISKAASRVGDYNLNDTEADIKSFRPLFLYIGEIILAIVGTMLIMSLLGFNLAAIITSAGLVSLGISMGAQDVLKQFFSGLEILATRPFKKGDLIAVGADAMVYRVRRVNVMNTILENWDNTDVFVMPNSLITTNKIRNITRETLISKVYLTVDIAYGSDVNLARKLMQEAATENPHVISDGSVKRPYTRLEAFEDSNLLIKMGFYVDEYGSQWAICGQIRQGIIAKFAANGIGIDYQQIVIHEAKNPETREGAAKTADDSE
ncbi:mechanosensitive ion channel protein [methanogenic archaeon ISO4-H5]|nr:mechanosensitive ion channel protein [methanogenic archaeon ISO4-H5]